MSPDVLILSSIYDFATDHVALELKDRGVAYLRLNREQLPEYELALNPTEPSLSVRHGDNRWDVSPDLKSVWFRQPVFLRNTPAEPLPPGSAASAIAVDAIPPRPQSVRFGPMG
jgi:hypothetical protein